MQKYIDVFSHVDDLDENLLIPLDRFSLPDTQLDKYHDLLNTKPIDGISVETAIGLIIKMQKTTAKHSRDLSFLIRAHIHGTCPKVSIQRQYCRSPPLSISALPLQYLHAALRHYVNNTQYKLVVSWRGSFWVQKSIDS